MTLHPEFVALVVVVVAIVTLTQYANRAAVYKVRSAAVADSLASGLVAGLLLTGIIAAVGFVIGVVK